MADTSSTQKEVIIIGGGPAGLAAATAAVRQLYRCVLFDSGVYRNANATHMHTVPGWDHQNPATFRAKARQDILARYDTIQFEDVAVTEVKKLDDGTFSAKDAQGRLWTAPKIVLAVGVRDIAPDIPGYTDLWTKRIFHCLFCHGYEERGAPSVGVLAIDVMLADSGRALHVTHMAERLASSVRIYTNGNTELASQITANLKGDKPYTVESRKIVQMSPGTATPTSVIVRLQDGTEHEEGFMTHAPRTETNGPFAQQLGLELTATGDIKVAPPFQTTNVPGVFAAGDCSTMMKQVTSAMFSGGMALVAATMNVIPQMPK
ncbi:thioredoxin reductase glit [Auriculariales sp. MPI-PUGE-AT-0066]|nr:thioredoxin reductase glit [Auriculariales sp. MPI-PUGE-AT-0066]